MRDDATVEFDEGEIAAEAFLLWQADGSPLWGHPQDHWYRAIEVLRARAAAAGVGTLEALTEMPGDSRRDAIGKERGRQSGTEA